LIFKNTFTKVHQQGCHWNNIIEELAHVLENDISNAEHSEHKMALSEATKHIKHTIEKLWLGISLSWPR
jgi:hypothetical protein